MADSDADRSLRFVSSILSGPCGPCRRGRDRGIESHVRSPPDYRDPKQACSQGALHMTAQVFEIPRGGIACGGSNDLIAINFSVLDIHPVTQRAPCSIDESGPATACFDPGGRCLKEWRIHGVFQFHEHFAKKLQAMGRSVEPGELARPCIGSLPSEEIGDERIACHNQFREGSRFHDIPMVAGSLRPALFPGLVGMARDSFSHGRDGVPPHNLKTRSV